MPIEGVPFEYVSGVIMEQTGASDFFDRANLFVGGIELQKGLGPEAPFGKRVFDRSSNLGVGDVDEAPNILSVVVDYLSVGIEDVHGSTTLESLASLSAQGAASFVTVSVKRAVVPG